jgi:hypothetical protein
MSRMLFLILSMFLLTAPVKAHDWYDRDCCSKADCRPIDNCDEIQELPKGMAKWGKYLFDKVRPSQDNKCHVCITSWEKPMCVYTQHGS